MTAAQDERRHIMPIDYYSPMRTKEELRDLIHDLTVKRYPKHRCEDCNGKFFVDLPIFAGECVGWRENSINTVAFRTNPFAEEIFDDHTKYWLCAACADEDAQDI